VDPKVYAHHSKVFAAYYLRKQDYENYYKSSLSYLAYTPPAELGERERKDLSIQLGMAILLGKNIYNIMELLDKEILQSLAGTDYEWLAALLNALGRGHINEFEQAVTLHADYISRFPTILRELEHLKQKVRIISFLELLFEVDKDERSLGFARIAEHCQIAQDDVELMLMKAMSLQLIKGTIDEVERVVHVNWILPRYLSRAHLEIMVRKLCDWEAKMEQFICLVEGQSELLQNL
jgi:26S proteasome regulatory subunit N9